MAPTQIVLNLGPADIPFYGHQPERFFYGYYDHYCYPPLYIFTGDKLFCALTACLQGPGRGPLHEVTRILAQLRECWLKVRSSCARTQASAAKN